MIVKKKMKVYLLFFNKGELAGVFSSIPKAHDFAEKWNKAFDKTVEVMYLVEKQLDIIDPKRKWINNKDDKGWVEVKEGRVVK